MSLFIIIVFVIIATVLMLPVWPYSKYWGYSPLITMLLFIIFMLALMWFQIGVI